MGASIVEVSHRLPIFRDILDSTESLFRELTNLPKNYRVLFMHGGAQMQFSAVPLNLMYRKKQKGSYFITGRWGILAEQEAQRYGNTEIIMDGVFSFNFFPIKGFFSYRTIFIPSTNNINYFSILKSHFRGNIMIFVFFNNIFYQHN